jgi:hypothetical protein
MTQQLPHETSDYSRTLQRLQQQYTKTVHSSGQPTDILIFTTPSAEGYIDDYGSLFNASAQT